MAELEKAVPKKSLLDRGIEAFVGFIAVLFLIFWTAVTFLGVYSDFKQGRFNDWWSIESVFLLSGFFSLCLSLSIVFPRIIGVRFKTLLSKIFRPLVIIKDLLSSKIVQYKLEDRLIYLLNNNKSFQSLYFLLCAAFFATLGSLNSEDERWFLEIARYTLYVASFSCAVMSLYTFFPKTLTFLGKSILYILLAILVFAGIYLLYFLLKDVMAAISGLPVSLAIILGALIIALAVRSKR